MIKTANNKCNSIHLILSFRFNRTFWIKVKSIIKVSLDRLRMLKLLNQPIFNRYEEIISLVNKKYDEERSLEEFN